MRFSAFFTACLLGAQLVVASPADLDRSWRGIEARQPGQSSRDLIAFALACAATDQHPERAEAALSLAAEMQDRDPASPTFGNLRWYLRDAHPDDLNAVEFCMQQAVLIWLLHPDRLTGAAHAELERLLRFGLEGVRRHRVRETYTNIYLMKCWNLIALGECLSDAAAAAEGRAALASWWQLTQTNGIAEYASPTYYGVDLDSLGLLAKHAPDAGSRAIADAAIRALWTDVAANWFEPGQRIGGAHSRDYDYLTGHGYLDSRLRSAGWMSGRPDRALEILFAESPAPCPADLRATFSGQRPRVVVRRWGSALEQTAVHYVGRDFSIGSAGSGYGPEDKVLVVNFPGGPSTVVGNFVMDGRGDAYGVRKEVTGGGHMKAHHLRAFVASAQRGPEVLLLAADDAATMKSGSVTNPTRTLQSHFVFPAGAEVWFGDRRPPAPAAGAAAEVPAGETVFLRTNGVAVALRLLVARATAGGDAPVRWIADGAAHGASRLTCTLAEGTPAAPGSVALWTRAAEGLDDAGFAAFRRAAQAEKASASGTGSVVDVSINGLRVCADVKRRKRIACEGGDAPRVGETLGIRYPAATRNPVWAAADNLRDPAVLKVDGGYHLIYSRLAGTNWGAAESWHIAQAFTRDFVKFENDRDVSPAGHASPGDVVRWHGRWILPYQTYPTKPTQLVFAESSDLTNWSKPRPFLAAALELPWNDARRVIDPTLVVDGGTLHCFFVGTTMKPTKANLLGHAITRDPKLEQWEILTRDTPLLGRAERAPDGVENVMVYRTGDHWTMLFSEGLQKQHLAWAISTDLVAWTVQGEVAIPPQEWMAVKYGAPFVWREADGWRMILMGQSRANRTTFGLLDSADGVRWTPLPESRTADGR